jgi:hypothetical protein
MDDNQSKREIIFYRTMLQSWYVASYLIDMAMLIISAVGFFMATGISRYIFLACIMCILFIFKQNKIICQRVNQGLKCKDIGDLDNAAMLLFFAAMLMSLA